MKNENEEYDGWTNSKTCIANLYLMQEQIIYKKLVAIVKDRKITVSDIKTLYYNEKHEPVDRWTKGAINFKEIAENFNDDNYTKMRTVNVMMENEKYNYSTNMNGTNSEIEKYFVGNVLNFGCEDDILVKCIAVKFLD